MSAAIDWRAEASRLSLPAPSFHRRKIRDAISGKTFDCTSPVDGAVLARVRACDAEDVDRAVKPARTAVL
jgi:acyl-CoA reductase-like NAD-dependent aldehyde dehydrogenase